MEIESERIEAAAAELRDVIIQVRMAYVRALHQAECDYLAQTTDMSEAQLRAAAIAFVENVLRRCNVLNAEHKNTIDAARTLQ